MNERIRELARQAGYEQDMFGIGHWDMPECKKLAELIVRECVKVCADRGNHHDGLYSAWASDCSERIEKHFGVKP